MNTPEQSLLGKPAPYRDQYDPGLLYPIPRAENQALYKRYEALADATDNVTFVGRLATYRYYNMDQIVGQALATFRKLDQKRRQRRKLETAVAAE